MVLSDPISAPSDAAPASLPSPSAEKDLEASLPRSSITLSSEPTLADEKVVGGTKEAIANEVQQIPKNNLAVVFTGLILCTFLAALDQVSCVVFR
jgi:hypothetical protein